MSTSAPIRVLCVDDHPLVRDGIVFAIQQQPDIEVVAQASDGLEAIDAYRVHRPDITLMDLQMPRMNGMEATAAIRREFHRARIIILTTYAGDTLASRALGLGAVGYMLKGMLRTELIDTIRRVHAGQKRISPAVAEEIAKYCSADALSTREVEVLDKVAAGFSNKMVGDLLDIAEDTVKGHMKNISAKLQANDRTHAVMIALRRGILDS